MKIMIPAFLYKYIYFLIITVLTLSEVQRLRSLNEKEGSLGSLLGLTDILHGARRHDLAAVNARAGVMC